MTLIFYNRKDERVGSLTVKDGKPVAEGFAQGLETKMVIEPDTNKRLTPKDGDRWLDAMRYLFRSGYVSVEVVRDS